MASAERRLTRIADRQNVSFGREIKRAMGIACALREGQHEIPDAMRDVYPVWAPTREISDAARADAFTKIADKVTGYADSDVGLERLGLSHEEIVPAEGRPAKAALAAPHRPADRQRDRIRKGRCRWRRRNGPGRMTC